MPDKFVNFIEKYEFIFDKSLESGISMRDVCFFAIVRQKISFENSV